jgi:hypothetical protein
LKEILGERQLGPEELELAKLAAEQFWLCKYPANIRLRLIVHQAGTGIGLCPS